MTKLLPLCLIAVVASPTLAALPRDYEILARKSIFARDRVSRVAGAERTRYPRTEPTRSTVPVLVGILREEAGFAAALEFPDTGRLAQVRIGDSLPGNLGTVRDITLDYLEYVPAAGQTPTRVSVGRNLQGEDAPVVAAAAPVATDFAAPPVAEPTTQSTTGEAIPAPAAGDDVLTRMRLRRQQEMNR